MYVGLRPDEEQEEEEAGEEEARHGQLGCSLLQGHRQAAGVTGSVGGVLVAGGGRASGGRGGGRAGVGWETEQETNTGNPCYSGGHQHV